MRYLVLQVGEVLTSHIENFLFGWQNQENIFLLSKESLGKVDNGSLGNLSTVRHCSHSNYKMKRKLCYPSPGFQTLQIWLWECGMNQWNNSIGEILLAPSTGFIPKTQLLTGALHIKGRCTLLELLFTSVGYISSHPNNRQKAEGPSLKPKYL